MESRFIMTWIKGQRFLFTLLALLFTGTITNAQKFFLDINNQAFQDVNTFGTVCVNTNSIELEFNIQGFGLDTQEVDINTGPDSLAGFYFSFTSGGPYTPTLAITSADAPSYWSGTNLNAIHVFLVYHPTDTGTFTWPGGIPLYSNGKFFYQAALRGNTYVVNTGTPVANLPIAAVPTVYPAVNPFVYPGPTSCMLQWCGAYAVCTTLTGYGVEYSTTRGFTPGTGTAVAGTPSSYSVKYGTFDDSITSGLTPGTTYYYDVYASAADSTVYSAQDSFTTLTASYSNESLTNMDFGNQPIFPCPASATASYTFTVNNLPQYGATGENPDIYQFWVQPPSGFMISDSPGGPFTANALRINNSGYLGADTSFTVYVQFSPDTVQSYNNSILTTYLVPAWTSWGNSNLQINCGSLTLNGVGISGMASLDTPTISNLTGTSATVNGFLNVGCTNNNFQGAELSISNFAPGNSGNQVNASNYNNGIFSVTFNNLKPGTTYYYDVYANVSGGNPPTQWLFSSVYTFTTLNDPLDAGVTGIVFPNGNCPGSQTVQAAVQNFGTDKITSVKVAWEFNYVSQQTVNATGLNIAPGATANITLGTITLPSPGTPFELEAYTQLPNGGTDQNTGNDTFQNASMNSALSGTFTVGTQFSGNVNNFVTITDAFNAIQQSGICGPTLLSLTDSNYGTKESFPLVLQVIAGTSQTNTLTIKPAAGVRPAIIGANLGLLVFVGTSYIIVDGSNTVGGTTRDLTISNTQTSNGLPDEFPAGIVLASADSNTLTTYTTIKNCNIIGAGAVADGSGIISCSVNTFGGPTDGPNSNNTIQNNNITAVTSGIYVNGNGDFYWNINGNTLGSTDSASQLSGTGIWIANAAYFNINQNTITGVVSSDTNAVAGIDVEQNTLGSSIYDNNITDIQQTNLGGYNANGILLDANTNGVNAAVYNNFVSNVISDGGGNPGCGITVNFGGYNIDFNSVSLATEQVGGGFSLALNVGSDGTTGTLNIRNNILVNTETANGVFAVAIANSNGAPNSIFDTINYNDYYVDPSYSSGYIGYLGSPEATLADWQVASGQDVHSITYLPVFTSASDLHINGDSATNSALYHTGTALSYVTTDIDGQSRNVPPCIGADEFMLFNIWTGATSTDWSVGSNWSSRHVPGATDDVMVAGGPSYPNQPGLTSSVSVRGISLLNYGTITVPAGDTLTIGGDLISNIGIFAGPGYAVFAGSGAQIITGSNTFTNLKIDNSDGVTIAPADTDTVSLSGVLTLQTGVLTTNGNLILTSASVNNVATIDNFSKDTYSGTINGNITAQRYYDSVGNSVDHDIYFWGSPVDAPAITQFGAQGVPGYVIPTADCNADSVAPNSPYSSVYAYNEDVFTAANCSLAAWDALTSGNATDGEGYAVLKPGAGTLSLTGPANLASSYTLPGLTNSGWQNTTLQGDTFNSGWWLMSNPYSANLNISNNGNGFDAQVETWVTDGPYAGSYQPLIAGSGYSYLSAFQGFMIHKTTAGGTATYTLNGTDRTIAPPPVQPVVQNELILTVTDTTTGLSDVTTVAFNAEATVNFDPQMDANKLPGSLARHTLYSVEADGQWMSINNLPSLDTTTQVAVGFQPGVSGAYTMSFAGVNSFDSTVSISLIDRLGKITQNVSAGNYTFTADSSDQWNRFTLLFTVTPVGINNVVDNNNIPIWSSQNKVFVDFSQLTNVKATVTIYNLLGQEIVSENYEGSDIYTKTIDNIDAGFVIVKVVNGDQAATRNVFISNAK